MGRDLGYCVSSKTDPVPTSHTPSQRGPAQDYLSARIWDVNACEEKDKLKTFFTILLLESMISHKRDA